MGRVKDIKNKWSVQGGENPQRSDLWQLDMQDVIEGLNGIESLGPDLMPSMPRYYAASVTLPELKVRGEMVRRDSRAYIMPGCDEPLEGVKVVFYMDDGFNNIASDSSEIPKSKTYTLLDTWRRVVRAGRGEVGSEDSITLNSNYTILFRFPVSLYLLRGYNLRQVGIAQANAFFAAQPVAQPTGATASIPFGSINDITGGMEISSAYRLENCWLSGFRVSDLTYEGSKALTIEALLYAENVLQVTTG